MSPRHITEVLIVTTAVIWTTWDIYAMKKGGVEATESQTIREWSKHPLVPFAVGILMGHFFFCESSLPWLR